MFNFKYMQHKKPKGTGGIRPSTPQYEFWMKFFEKEPDLRTEFQWRISQNDGFICWDFLPGNRHIAKMHPSQQYRKTLYSVKDTLESLCLNRTNINSRYLAERINYLRGLKVLTDQILLKRKRDIDEHDTLANRVIETFSSKKPTKKHKEVYEIWIEIRNAIIHSLEVLTNEMSQRERQKRESAAQNNRNNDTVCVIL